jgi:hypothetical protein
MFDYEKVRRMDDITQIEKIPAYKRKELERRRNKSFSSKFARTRKCPYTIFFGW